MNTLRDTARQAVIDALTEGAAHQHHRNYWKLHVERDGTVHWSEFTSSTDDTIDRDADHFAAIPSVATVGTGSIDCNCDHCIADYASREEAIAEAVSDSDLTHWTEQVLAEFDAIGAGYFNDEGPYAVYWDNGASGCGTFSQRFRTEAEAEAWGDNWARERNLEDLGLTDEQVEERGGEGCYTAEVIEVEEAK